MLIAGSDATDVRSRATPVAAAIFVLIAVLIGVDVAADAAAGGDRGHLLTEGAVMILALGGAAVLWRQLTRARTEARILSVDLEAARREADRYRAEAGEALRGLGEAI